MCHLKNGRKITSKWWNSTFTFIFINFLCLKKADVIHNSNGRKSIYSSNFFYPSIYFVLLNFHEFELVRHLFTWLETMGSDLIFFTYLPWFLLNQGKISTNLSSYVKIIRFGLTKVSFTNSRFTGFDTKKFKNQQKLLKYWTPVSTCSAFLSKERNFLRGSPKLRKYFWAVLAEGARSPLKISWLGYSVISVSTQQSGSNSANVKFQKSKQKTVIFHEFFRKILVFETFDLQF